MAVDQLEPQATEIVQRDQDPAQDQQVWNPIDTKIFDVFLNNESFNDLHLLDIFSNEVRVKQMEMIPNNSDSNKRTDDSSYYQYADNINNNGNRIKREEDNIENMQGSSEEEVELFNSGIGKQSPNLQNVISKKRSQHLHRTPSMLSHLSSLKIEDINKSPEYTQLTPHTAYKEGNDKWTPDVEAAFMDALRLIMKNGTSKIKIRDRNFGRNELISLYIQFHTREIRTKKQVSSHIQVLKKTIQNKRINKQSLTTDDHEILSLIENGAVKDPNKLDYFYSTFENIIDNATLESSDVNSTSSSIKNNLMTPMSANNLAQNAYKQDSQNDDFQHPGGSHPMTPLDYAQSIYQNLTSYKCVPVKLEAENYLAYSRDANELNMDANELRTRSNDSQVRIARNPNNRSNDSPRSSYPTRVSPSTESPIKQWARHVELQQRQLIENAQNQLNPNTYYTNPYSKAYSPAQGSSVPYQPSAPAQSCQTPSIMYYNLPYQPPTAQQLPYQRTPVYPKHQYIPSNETIQQSQNAQQQYQHPPFNIQPDPYYSQQLQQQHQYSNVEYDTEIEMYPYYPASGTRPTFEHQSPSSSRSASFQRYQ
ncbi:hypothetical protein NCAS_0I01360 [Naumovozyma castellii]|uniref:TEA domain-containing protein n=1 Tax=Naumovozyma castellii TaxID=27288 RepID=G0VJX2_NAUCA|nr:hypothetical protein NCAS_0I01360 [Naumovozyma castellii CBS 4309]CCC71804.1 hypothetical protein NCAS_0I01360 [Naumovozyma castellii CBS 4309]